MIPHIGGIEILEHQITQLNREKARLKVKFKYKIEDYDSTKWRYSCGIEKRLKFDIDKQRYLAGNVVATECVLNSEQGIVYAVDDVKLIHETKKINYADIIILKDNKGKIVKLDDVNVNKNESELYKYPSLFNFRLIIYKQPCRPDKLRCGGLFYLATSNIRQVDLSSGS
ncbi:hypothetical protein J7384_18380 [Endozoicomonas sp. G2_1]|uniref:hypothetical protein n=1 Tax=Endozoicomonas sp. G2_1 TaxID=2821091 RepID=UPI001AD9B21D|nr:hypothetical protein [Endozoicomonas sp. G2_1]MBO9492335.1 hypothetical protein [Endozoicomonas sp. G2_1]